MCVCLPTVVGGCKSTPFKHECVSRYEESSPAEEEEETKDDSEAVKKEQ